MRAAIRGRPGRFSLGDGAAPRAVSFSLGTTGALLAGGGVAFSVAAAAARPSLATIGLAVVELVVAVIWLAAMYLATPLHKPPCT